MSRAAKAQPVPEAARELPAFDADSALHLLLRAAAPHMQVAELQWLAEAAPAHAAELASRAAVVANGVACLVLSDGAGDGGPDAGNFQSAADVPDLLLHFADTFTHVGALASLASEAHSWLRERGAA